MVIYASELDALALQGNNLAMVGLGSVGDMPPNDLQPRLPDGIHLRWASARELGFPWFGYFLFRRRHRSGKPVCVREALARMPSGSWSSSHLATPYGVFTSDVDLVFTDDFPAEGVAEIDLGQRELLRFTMAPDVRPSHRVDIRVGIREGAGGVDGQILIRALQDDVLVAEANVAAEPGEVVTESLSADAISVIELTGSDAALLDVCCYPVSQNARQGWERVPEFRYPLALPVRHPQYPCAALPTSLLASQALGMSRVKYGPDDVWAGTRFAQLHEQLVKLVQEGPSGTPMVDQSTSVPGTSTPPDSVGEPTMLEQYPLELVLFGSLNPAIAQMVGLYWVDEHAEPGQSYDYMIVADNTSNGVSHRNPDTVLEIIATEGFASLDGYIVFDKRLEHTAPLAPPTEPRVYALPGTTVATTSGDLVDATNNAGVRWKLDQIEPGELLPGSAVMYHVWRDDRGADEAPDPAQPPETYTPTTDPAIVAESAAPGGASPSRPADWPPFPLHYIDRGLSEGWYSYRVSGIDIFGRHSPASEDAQWLQWGPVPDPRPWYYQDPPGESVIDNAAVRLLDKIGPPVPEGLEAAALDPGNPILVRDALYESWQASLGSSEQASVIGLRVRWLWTEAHRRQSPDAREFRIYLQPDELNAFATRVTSTSAVSATETEVDTDLSNELDTDAYVGAWLRLGASAFRIVESGAADPLTLRVANIGPGHDVAPQPGATCALTIPRIYNSGRISVATGSAAVTGTDSLWTSHLVGMRLQVVGEFATYEVAAVNSPTELLLDRLYEESSAVAVPYGIEFHLFTDFTVPTSWAERFYVVGLGEHVTETIDADGRPLREYELIIPVDGDADRDGLQLATSPAVPIRYASIGVSAADDKVHTEDDPKWQAGSWGGRFGNEGPVSPPAKIFVVHREPPPPPSVPADSERLLASRADYHSHSFFTYRWVPAADLKTHVFRALDDTVFKTDWERRATDQAVLDPTQADLFPAEWDLTKRQHIADELNQLNGFDRDTERDQAMTYYTAMSNDGLRALAGLPGNNSAFTQLTITPLDPDDPDNANRLGPDNPGALDVDPGLRAYVDTLDGRSRNRYFYRCAYVDSVHNRGPLSLSSPPIWLPDVIPPRTPVITGVVGGDRQITLRWAPNRETDLADYHVYRTDIEDDARDTRTMTLVRAQPPSPTTSTGLSWTDAGVAGLRTYYYRLVAVDAEGNVSVPSLPVAARAFDSERPAHPVWSATAPGPNPGDLILSWLSDDASLRCLVQRRAQSSTTWESLGSWLPRGVFTYLDTTRTAGVQYDYRLRVMDSSGVLNDSYNQLTG